jgi:S-DNA-T family DNA segregation ATPase FtsK/SpoIIIE
LQLNDPTDYSSVLGSVNGVYPSKFKGRGIFKNQSVYEFQTAHITRDVENTLEYVRNYCSKYEKKWTDIPASKVPILPEKVDALYLSREINACSDDQIPIGIEKSSLNTAYYFYKNSYINLILAKSKDNTDFVQGLAEVFAAKGTLDVIVIDPEGAFVAAEETGYKLITGEFDKTVVDLFDMIVYRNNTYKDARAEGRGLPVFKQTICIINSLASLMSLSSGDSKDKIKNFLEKGSEIYNVNFILFESVNNISSMTFENWYKTKVSLNNGIWLGDGFTEQYQLKPTKITNDLYQEIGDKFGYLLVKGKAKLIKLLTSVTNDTEVEIDG